MYKPRRKGLDLMTKRSLAGWLFVLPFLIGFLFFVISPMYTSLMLSIHSQSIVYRTEPCTQYVAVNPTDATAGYYVVQLDENGERVVDSLGEYIYEYELDADGNVVTEKVEDEFGVELEIPVKKIIKRPEYFVLILNNEGEKTYDKDGNVLYEMVTNENGETVRKVVTATESQDALKYVGLDNYIKAVTKNLNFINQAIAAAGRLIYIPAILIFSFLIANVLNSKFVGRTAARAIFFMPVITASGIAARVKDGSWEVARFGSAVTGSVSGTGLDMVSTMTNLLREIEGLSPFVDFITSAFGELSNIVLYSGIQILIFLAALQTISPSLFEASDVEGASKWEAFWKITFPMVSPMILVALVYTMIDVLVGSNNPMISYLFTTTSSATISLSDRMAMGWMYFLVTAILIVIVSVITSLFVYNENDTKVRKNRG